VVGAEKPRLFRTVVIQRGLRRLRGCSRHGRDLAHEYVELFNLTSFTHGHRRFFTFAYLVEHQELTKNKRRFAILFCEFFGLNASHHRRFVQLVKTEHLIKL
jgi:hypothetical protein